MGLNWGNGPTPGITGLRKQNDIIKDLVKKNAVVVKEKDRLAHEVHALRDELTRFQVFLARA